MATDDPTGEDGAAAVLAASVALALLLQRYHAGLRRQAGTHLERLQAAVLARVRAADLPGIAYPPSRAAESYRLSFEVGELVGQTFGAIRTDLLGDLVALSRALAEHAAQGLQGAAGGPVSLPHPAEVSAIPGALLVTGATLGAWLEKHAADLDFRLRRLVADAAAGAGPAVTAAAIRSAIVGASAATDTTVRSAVTGVSAMATAAVISANRGAGHGYVWLAILDGKTTPECRSRSGLKWDADRQPVGHRRPFRTPPIHLNCRSSIAAWVAGTKAPKEPTLGEYLSGLTDDQQETLVGFKKAQMWREKKISTAGLLDASARPIGLATLRRLLGLPPA